jgi:multidrug efflux pump subunit AcrB
LSIDTISQTLGISWGSAYVNQFVDHGRVKRVFVQGEAASRMLPQDMDKWYVRNAAGGMTPFSAFAVVLVVPLGILGTVCATLFRGLGNDVFFQVGLLTTVGLSAKNAILIVEFAKENVEHGMGLVEATVSAARQRLRPILMTSFAFILGVMPLALAAGAGAGGRIAIGTGVIGGMVTGTLLAVFFVPVFFVSVRSVFQGSRQHDDNTFGQPALET